MSRRAVITGVGLITPLGIGVDQNVRALTAGKSGIGGITHFDCTAFASQIAGEVKDFDPTRWMPPREARTLDRFLHFAIACGADALADSGLPPRFDDEEAERTGCYVGAGWGGVATVQKNYKTYLEKGPRFFSPYAILASIINLAPSQLSIRHNIRGPVFSQVSACATGAHCIGEAARTIKDGTCDVMLAGGTEAAVEVLGIGFFAAARALSTRNDAPQAASRPFDNERDGFVLGEGAGVVVLEDFDHARKRNARIYAEVLGYGTSADAFHPVEPSPEGKGAQTCMRNALKNAKISAEQVDYINAHGTSTRYNDAAETRAIKAVFGEHSRQLAVSSTKSMTGHTLGAAGAIEAIFCALSLQQNCLFPTINYEHADPECDLDYVANEARQQNVNILLSNSFGFGGTNAALIFCRV